MDVDPFNIGFILNISDFIFSPRIALSGKSVLLNYF